MLFEIKSKNEIRQKTSDSHDCSEFKVLNSDSPYSAFFEEYMQLNIPCLFKDTTKNWEATSKWLINGTKINLNYLKNKYGHCDVTIYHCNERYFNSQKTECCTFEKFLKNYWNNNNEELKYLKDWHLKNQMKDDNFYQVPIYFASDWLNEYLINNSEDDYRFVYFGQAGTWTPFHADVFNSYSWSANICGLKKWILFPPGEENSFRDNLNNLPYDISEIYHNRKHYELLQYPGQAIFVPSGWYHQVWNLEDTISVNHNWINGCNIEQMWLSITSSLDSVKKEIEDCKDMDDFLGHCQIMLNASYGMNFYKFFDFIKFIALKRMHFLASAEENNILFHGHAIGKSHSKFDLFAVKKVLEKFVWHKDIEFLFCDKDDNPHQLLSEINQFIIEL